MKINVFLSSIAIVLTALIGYWIYDIAKGHENDVFCGVCSSACILSTLIPILGLQYNSVRIGINIRALSGLFLAIFLISHFCYAIFGILMPSYLIVNGVLLLIYFAVLYKCLRI